MLTNHASARLRRAICDLWDLCYCIDDAVEEYENDETGEDDFWVKKLVPILSDSDYDKSQLSDMYRIAVFLQYIDLWTTRAATYIAYAIYPQNEGAFSHSFSFLCLMTLSLLLVLPPDIPYFTGYLGRPNGIITCYLSSSDRVTYREGDTVVEWPHFKEAFRQVSLTKKFNFDLDKMQNTENFLQEEVHGSEDTCECSSLCTYM